MMIAWNAVQRPAPASVHGHAQSIFESCHRGETMTKHQRYNRSEKGKARNRRYESTYKALRRQRRYEVSEKGQLTRFHYLAARIEREYPVKVAARLQQWD